MPNTSYQDMEHLVKVARPRTTEALFIPYDDLDFLKKKLTGLKTNVNYFVSAGFFFLGTATALFIQVTCGDFTRTIPSNLSINEIVLWIIAFFCVLSAIGSFWFGSLRSSDLSEKKVDLLDFINRLEGNVERDCT